MDRFTRMRLDMIHRVHALSLKHSATIPGYVDAVQKLGDRLARAESLAAQQETGDLQADASTARKDDLRQVIESEYVEHLVRIARGALPSDPELRNRFRLPGRGVNRQEFVAAVRAILAEAASRRELFIADGMAGTSVEDLEGLLTRYLDALSQKSLGEAQRVGAVAELPEVTKELMQLVRRLDGINRKRWQKNPELLAAWRSTKDVTWPHVKPVAPAPAPGPAPGEEGGGEESVA